MCVFSVEIRCPPQYITNGTAVFTGVLYQGDDVTVSCNTGFEVTGSNPYKCGIQDAPTCQGKIYLNVRNFLSHSPSNYIFLVMTSPLDIKF